MVLPIHVVRFWATVEGGEEAGEMGGGGRVRVPCLQ